MTSSKYTTHRMYASSSSSNAITNYSIPIVLLPLVLSYAVQLLTRCKNSNQKSGVVYKKNNRIFFQPPGYVFGVVWTTLYLCLGVYLSSLIKATASPSFAQHRYTLLVLVAAYATNLLVNLAWMPVVNDMNKPVLGIFMIGVMIGTALCALAVDPSPMRRGLMTPYLAWLFVALALNVELARSVVAEEGGVGGGGTSNSSAART